jgi:hypothetical protein
MQEGGKVWPHFRSEARGQDHHDIGRTAAAVETHARSQVAQKAGHQVCRQGERGRRERGGSEVLVGNVYTRGGERSGPVALYVMYALCSISFFFREQGEVLPAMEV